MPPKMARLSAAWRPGARTRRSEGERNGIGAGYVLRPSTRTHRIAALEGWRYWRRLSRHLAVPVVRLDARHRGFLQCAAGAIQMASARNSVPAFHRLVHSY